MYLPTLGSYLSHNKDLCMLDLFGILCFLLVLSVEHVKGGEVQAHIKASYKNNSR